MFASLEVIGGSIVLLIYVIGRTDDFLKGLLVASAISVVIELMLLLTMRRFFALYALLAVGVSAGWAWVGYHLAPDIFSDPNAPLYGAGLLGVGSLLEKFLQPEGYFEDHGGRVGEALKSFGDIFK